MAQTTEIMIHGVMTPVIRLGASAEDVEKPIRAELAAIRAEAAALTYPKIQNETWWVWDVEKGNYVDTGIRAQGTPGVYVLADGETIEDAPVWANVVVNPDEEPPALELTATFVDGTTQTYTLYGEAVTE